MIFSSLFCRSRAASDSFRRRMYSLKGTPVIMANMLDRSLR